MDDVDIDRYRNSAITTAILMEAGIELMRQNIRRRDPTLREEEVTARLSSWLWRMDDQLPGDTAGAVRIRERAQ